MLNRLIAALAVCFVGAHGEARAGEIIGPTVHAAETRVIAGRYVSPATWNVWNSARREDYRDRRAQFIADGNWIEANEWYYLDLSPFVPAGTTHIFLTGGFRSSSPHGDKCTQIITIGAEPIDEDFRGAGETTFIHKQHTRGADASFGAFMTPLDDDLGVWVFWRTQGFRKHERCSYSAAFWLQFAVTGTK